MNINYVGTGVNIRLDKKAFSSLYKKLNGRRMSEISEDMASTNKGKKFIRVLKKVSGNSKVKQVTINERCIKIECKDPNYAKYLAKEFLPKRIASLY